MGWFDFMTPQRSAPAKDTGSAIASSNAGPANSEAQGQSGGGIGGWFRSAGSWVADKWDTATTAVGDFTQRTGQLARDVWEVAAATDLSWKDGKLAIDTDLDEVMDLMPESVRDSLQLDRENSENRIKLEFDRNTGALTASSDDLRVRSVSTDKLKTGAVHLQGAKITLSNPGGGIPGLDEGFSLLGYQDKADNLSASLQIDGMEAENIELSGKDGPIAVQSIQTGGLKANASSEGGMPFADKGSSSAGFSVDKAIVKGLTGAGIGADELSVEHAEAGISEGSETAFLETSGLNVRGGRQGERSLGDASVEHARVDVRNRGGGAVFLDDAEDHMVADVAVSTAGVHDFAGGDQRVGGASLAGLRASWSQDAGTVTASADDLKASKVDTAGVDVGDVDLDGVKVELGPQGEGKRLNVAADRARVDDLAVDPTQRSAGPNTMPDLAFKADLGSLEMNRASMGQGSLLGLNARDLRAEGNTGADGLGLRAGVGQANATKLAWGQDTVGSLGLSGLDATRGQDGGLDLSLARGEVSGVNTRWGGLDHGTISRATGSMHGERLQAGLGAAHLDGLSERSSGVRVGSADLGGLSATSDHGKLEADLAHLGATGLAYRDMATLDSLSLDGVHASNASGRTEARFREGGLDGLDVLASGTPAHLGSLRAMDGTLSLQDGAIRSEIATAAASDLRYADVTAAEIATKNLSASIDPNATALGADGVQVDRLATRNFSADTLSATEAQARMSGGDYEASLASARAEKARVADRLGVDLATMEGVHANVRGDRRSVSLDAAHVGGVTDDPTKSSLQSGDLSGLRLEDSPDGTRAALDQLTLDQLRSGQNSAARVSLSGLEGRRSADGISGDLRSASADQLEMHAPGTDASLAHLGLERGHASLSSRGLDASLGQLSASDARFSTGLGGGSSSSGAELDGLDTAKLVRTLSARVDDASISASAPLREGDIPGAPISVKKDTDMTANIDVRDGALTQGTRVSLSRNLDAPLWIGVRGAYMDDKNRLMADISGWGDQNVSKSLNEGLGISGDRMPNLATLGGAVADKMSAPSTGSTGGGPSAADIVDMDRLHANARVGLSAGTIDAGSVGSLTLGRSSTPGSNTLHAEVSGRDQVLASFSELLASSFRADVMGNQIQAGQSTLSDARVAADLQGADAGLRGSLGSAELRDLGLHSSSVTLPATGKKPNS